MSSLTAIVTLVFLAAAFGSTHLFLGQASASGGTTPVVVSLEFDDGTQDQLQVLPILDSHGMKATFFINSGRIGLTNYDTPAQVQSLAADGMEIAGHTVSHADLPTLDSAEMQRQVCDDRVALLNMGFQVYDFAYPYGDNNAQTDAVVQSCGYNSGRDIGGVFSPASNSCNGCPYADTIPPGDPYSTRTPDSIKSFNTLQDLENFVTAAEQNGGGWLQLVMHHLCSGTSCDTLSVDPATLSAFLDWLQGHAVTTGTTVQTVHQVIGGALQPPVNGPPPSSGTLQNGSLEDPASGSLPTCWSLGAAVGSSPGTVGTGTRTSDAHSGSKAYTLSISQFTSGGDKRLFSNQDLGSCAPAANPGDVYQLSAWYKTSLSSGARLTAYTRNSSGGWTFFAQGPLLPAASTYTQTTWTIPAMPAGATGVSVAMSLRAVGSITVDDFSLTNANTDTTPPTVQLTAPSDGATVTGPVTMTATASDNVAVSKVEFYAGTQLVASDTSAPYTAIWDGNTSQSNLGLTAKAYDPAGNTAVSTANVTVEPPPPPPNAANMLWNPSFEQLQSGSTTALNCWQLTTSNGAVWTRVTDAHSGAWGENVSIATYSGTGDAKLIVDQHTQSCWPSVTPGATYTLTGWYKGNAKTRFALYTHSAGGWAFWTDSPMFAVQSSWTQASWTTPQVPAGTDALSVGMNLQQAGSLTFDDFGMTQAAASPPDTTPPTISLTAPADGATVNGQISLAANAADDVGVSKVEFYVGSALIGTSTSSSYSASWDTTTVANGPYAITAKAYDAAGNTTISAPVHVTVANDNTPPTSTIACNNTSCASTTYTAAVSVTLSATDNTGGSGVSQIRYTTDGSTPTATTGTVYTGTFTLSTTTTVKYLAVDKAGNVETAHSQTINISTAAPDTTPPTTTISCNGDGCSSWFEAAVTVTLSANDNAGGSGVGQTRYTTNGTDPTLTNGTVYSGPFTVSATATVKFRSWDKAGNAETVKSQLVQIDIAAPAVSIASPSNGSTVSSGGGTVRVAATATDTGGSGMASVSFYLDGVLQTTVTGSGPSFTWQWNAKKFAKGSHTLKAVATDRAGNQTTSATITVTET